MSGIGKSSLRIYLSAYHSEVTGSRLMLVIQYPNGKIKRILIDCGYFQEIEYRYLNYIEDFNPESIDAVLVTHNHIDHTGLLPKMVKNGYRGKIYMSQITKELLPKFLIDSSNQQAENCKYMRDKYPDDAYMFEPLYDRDDVNMTIAHCEGKEYLRKFHLFKDEGISVAVTFFENGHILGASMILVECKFAHMKSLNFFFTGDYKLTNMFFPVAPLPKRIRDMELIMVHEATYGTTSEHDIKKCFDHNMSVAFEKRQNILIGAFAQGRMQEILYRLKLMQDSGKIPSEYEIIVDGPLGISTTKKYKSILEWYNPQMADFLPQYTEADPKSRSNVLSLGHPVIVVTTSGMLSNGPARVYVPIFLTNENAMIHLTGYAAEETLARTLLDSKRDETITIGGVKYPKHAVIKTTREMTSHATVDDMINFINQFKNIRLLLVNHGATSVKDSLIDYIADSCDNVMMTDILDRKNMYCIYQFGKSGEKSSNITVKKLPANLDRYRLPSEGGKTYAKKKRSGKKHSKKNNKVRYKNKQYRRNKR